MDPAKVEVILRLSKFDFMEDDGYTPSVRRIKSVFGMIFYYQHFIPSCSSLAKPLFALTDPFVRTVSSTLMTERYHDLLVEAEEVNGDGVRDVFRQGAQNSQACFQSCSGMPSDRAAVEACLSLPEHWEETSQARAVQLVQSFRDAVPAGFDVLPVITADEIRESQEADPVISKVMTFVSLKRYPSR